MSNGHHHSIVVGVDGSEASKTALRWAVRYAGLVNGRITAVMAWDYPMGYGYEVPSYIREDFPAATATALSEAIVEVVGDDRSLEVHQKVVQGHPARTLLDVAEEVRADLIVVGNRGYGGFTEALLGSVGQYIVHHATCPVVVTREPEREPAPARS